MTWYHCTICGNPIMHAQDYPHAYPKEQHKEYWDFVEETKEKIICRCCRWRSERNCLTGCKQYDSCKIPDKKKKYHIRYTPNNIGAKK